MTRELGGCHEKLVAYLAVLLIVGASSCAIAAGPSVLDPLDDPRITHFAAAQTPNKVPAQVSQLLQQAKSVLPGPKVRHPADEANSPTAAGSWFGFSIAASSNYVVVGAPRMNAGAGVDSVRACLFQRFGSKLRSVRFMCSRVTAATGHRSRSCGFE